MGKRRKKQTAEKPNRFVLTLRIGVEWPKGMFKTLENGIKCLIGGLADMIDQLFIWFGTLWH